PGGETHAPNPALPPHPQADAALCNGFNLPPNFIHIWVFLTSFPREARVVGEEHSGVWELKWGEFEEMDFGSLDPSEKKLQFYLTESAGKRLQSRGRTAQCSPPI
ncbi:hypothetical protein BC827DRAFT_1231354, partial [Russula dissimulans]